MKVVMVTDEIPKSCEDCIFYSEILEQSSEHENQFEVVNGCSLTNKRNGKCILTEDKEYMNFVNSSEKEFIVIVGGDDDD